MTWKTSGGLDVTTGKAGFSSIPGEFDPDENSQTTTLTVDAAQNKNDDTYECIVSSTEHGVSEQSTTVHLKVFSKCIDLEMKFRTKLKGNIHLSCSS